MKLFEVAARRFSVRAVYDEDGLCQVMKKMVRVSREHQELAQQMAALLYEEVPDKGPPEDPWRFSSLYEGVIYQLKAVEFITKDDRLGLRIACFFDSESTIICTNAFYKKGTTPSGVVSLVQRTVNSLAYGGSL
jgi:hypothetical protein